MIRVKNKSNNVESEFTSDDWDIAKKNPRWNRIFKVVEKVKPIEIQSPDLEKPKAEAEVKSKIEKTRVRNKPEAKPEEKSV